MWLSLWTQPHIPVLNPQSLSWWAGCAVLEPLPPSLEAGCVPCQGKLVGCRGNISPFWPAREGFGACACVTLSQPEFFGSSTVLVLTLSTPVGAPCLLGHFCLDWATRSVAIGLVWLEMPMEIWDRNGWICSCYWWLRREDRRQHLPLCTDYSVLESLGTLEFLVVSPGVPSPVWCLVGLLTPDLHPATEGQQLCSVVIHAVGAAPGPTGV